MRHHQRLSGFSLVEVVVAIGIASFALLAVVGLLPVGMKSAQTAREQAAAASVMNSIANALRYAETTNGTVYSNSFAGQGIAYTIGGAAMTVAWDTLDLNGRVVDSASTRLKVRLVLAPPVNSMTPGQALISIAWPAQAPNLKWDNNKWTNASGHLTTGIQFLPKQ